METAVYIISAWAILAAVHAVYSSWRTRQSMKKMQGTLLALQTQNTRTTRKIDEVLATSNRE